MFGRLQETIVLLIADGWNFRDRLSVSKRAAKNLDLETLILKKLKKVNVVEQYGLKMSKRITRLENLDDSGCMVLGKILDKI